MSVQNETELNKLEFKKHLRNKVIVATIVLFLGIAFAFLFKLLTFLATLCFFVYSLRIRKELKKTPVKIRFDNKLFIHYSENKQTINEKFTYIVDKKRKKGKLILTKGLRKKVIWLRLDHWVFMEEFINSLPQENINYESLPKKGLSLTDLLFMFDL